MEQSKLEALFEIGETIAVEFKRCGNGIETDTYETVCSFLNRHGGDIFLGVLDDGTVIGLSEHSIRDMIKNFIKMISNPDILNPTIYLIPEKIEYKGKFIIHIHVPASSEVHRYKKVIYDRVDDSDVKITSTSQIAAMYIRKQDIFTEKRIYKYVKKEDLRLDLLPICRQRAINKRANHPWKDLDDDALLRSAGLFCEDYATGEVGYNLAAVMLLGKDEVIQSICPAYKTDAILRKVNLDRYDDRDIVKTNLIESYDRLMEFAQKHLWDKFYLEDNVSISLRDKIAREMLANTLIHREYSSSFIAKFIIEDDKMYTENACRASKAGEITPDNLAPSPKNPIIASFFNQIGNADELGSGTRNLFKYSKRYSGENPTLYESDIFKIIVPLNNFYSFDAEVGDKVGDKVGDRVGDNFMLHDNLFYDLTENQKLIIMYLQHNPKLSASKLADYMSISSRKVESNIKKLRELGLLIRHGSPNAGYWEISKKYSDY